MDIKFIMFVVSVNRLWSGIVRNNTCHDVAEEIRWKVLKAMLDDFPQLRQHVKEYLQIGKNTQ